MRGLDGKRAIVTGGGAGIGRAICRRLGEEGCVVAIFDERLARTRVMIGALTRFCMTWPYLSVPVSM